MTQIPSLGGAVTAAREAGSAADGVNELDLDDFLKLMIAELQNQDPLEPLDNSQMLQQISQIREIGATDQLTQTLETILSGQNVTSATSLIGQWVEGVSDEGSTVSGIVTRVSITDGVPQLAVDGTTTAAPSPIDGAVDEGTYKYRVVFEDQPGQPPFAVDVGPVTTTGSRGLEPSIALSNLPVTTGPKRIYRTDGTGSGDYHFVAEADGRSTQLVDTLAQSALPGGVLTGQVRVHPGGHQQTVSLSQIAQVRLARSGQSNE